jgi:hypothetical protein
MNILREGSPERKTLDKLRSDIGATKAELEKINAAPATDAETRERFRNALEAALQNGIPGYSYEAFRYDFRASLPSPITWADLCYVYGMDGVLDLLMGAVSRHAREPQGLPAADRAARVAELQAHIKKLERKAEIEICALEDRGYNVLRDEHADVQMMLEVWARIGASNNEAAAPEIRT